MNEAKLGLKRWDMCSHSEKLERLRSVLRSQMSQTLSSFIQKPGEAESNPMSKPGPVYDISVLD